MERRNLCNLLVVLGMAIAMAGGVVMARQAWAQEGIAPQTFDVRASVGTAFTYQGRLLREGTPVEGGLEFFFTLWDEPGGSTVAEYGPITVEVKDGYFSAPLAFGAVAFDGHARYLQVIVEGTPLEPLVELTAAPYAFRAEYVNHFADPHYDSGWVQATAGGTKSFTHNLGGDVDDYVIDLWGKTSEGGMSQAEYYIDSADKERGAYWHSLNATQIGVYRGANDQKAFYVRVRIWRVE